MPRALPPLAVVAAFALGLALVSRVAAQDGRAEATPIFEEGVALAEAGDWSQALARFERAYALYPHVNIRLNLAAAQAETGHLLASVATYEALLAELAEAPPRRRRRGPEPETVAEALRRVRGRTPLLAVAVAAPEPGDIVRIDDVAHELSTLVEGIALDPGAHTLTWVRAGTVLGTSAVTLTEGSTETLRIEAAGSESVGGGGGGEVPGVTTGGAREPVLTVIGVGLLGLGAVSLAVMIGAMAQIDSLSGDETLLAYRAAIPFGTAACAEASAGEEHGQGEDTRLRVVSVCGDASSWEIVQYVFLATGVAALGAGLALVLVDATSADDASARLVPHLSPTRAGLSLEGAF